MILICGDCSEVTDPCFLKINRFYAISLPALGDFLLFLLLVDLAVVWTVDDVPMDFFLFDGERLFLLLKVSFFGFAFS